jgi:hypothetical protein
LTSISAYRIYRTSCCHDVFDEPIFGSSNAETVFRTTEPQVVCECGECYSKSELEFVGIKRESINDLRAMGLADVDIPSFLRKQKLIEL